VLAKAVNPSVNTLALQKQSKLPYSFDARSFCKKVVVKFWGTASADNVIFLNIPQKQGGKSQQSLDTQGLNGH
jgi:hypothetical protein